MTDTSGLDEAMEIGTGEGIPDVVCSGHLFVTSGQGRLDGAFCDYTAADKMLFLREAYDRGVRNIEMESVCFAAFCRRANIRGAVVCAAMLNRFEDDQVHVSRDIQRQWEQRPTVLVSRLITQRLSINAS